MVERKFDGFPEAMTRATGRKLLWSKQLMLRGSWVEL